MNASLNNPNDMLVPFNNAVVQVQQVFRVLLKALSEPATILTLPEDVNQNTDNTMWAVAQTLLDGEVSAYFDDSLGKLATSSRFFTGVHLVDDADLAKADYIFVTLESLQSQPEILAKANTGNLEMPHTSATVVVLVEELNSESSTDETVLTVTGAGVETQKQVSIKGLSTDMIATIQQNHAQFPCGLDWYFCTTDKVMGLPRTSEIKVA